MLLTDIDERKCAEEVRASDAVFMTEPTVVAATIEQAAKGASRVSTAK